MNTRPIPRLCASLALAATCALPNTSLARQIGDTRTPQPDPTPPIARDAALSFSTSPIVAAPIDGLLFDEPGDGALWVRGSSYKASFDAAGATLIPFFGSDAPRNFPLALRTKSVTLAGESIDVAPGAVERDGDEVRIERGAFFEQYLMRPDSLEQRFVFPTLPASGELVVRLDAHSELAARDLGATLRFENELGRIDYSEAFAIDAAGRKIALDSTLVDGAIEMRVPADFVAGAQFPLVIDPFVTFFTVSTSSPRHDLLCDVAYDASTDQWGVSFVNIWSSTDYDVFVRLVSGAGALQGTYTIDFSGAYWSTPKIANNNFANGFLVVAAVVPNPGPAAIHGRTLDALALTVGAAFQISPADGAYRNAPDVGGDPYPGGSYYCVVWQRSVSASNVDIEMVMVAGTGGVATSVVALENGSGWNELPSISNSFGIDTGDQTAAWNVVWQYRYSSSDYDIYGARVNWNGAILSPLFAIETSTWDERNPSVSTSLAPGGAGVHRPYMVVYERNYGDRDVVATVMSNTSIVNERNLVGDVPSTAWYREQLNPSLDSDGELFLIGFDERDVVGGANTTPDVWTSTYFLAGSQLSPCEVRRNFAGSSTYEAEIEVCSMASTGGPLGRFFGTWVYLSLNNGYDVQGGLWDGCSGGLVESFCAGDGSGAACPCNNTGAVGRGCRNSQNGNGGLLSPTGNASVSADTFRLNAVGLPLGGSCLFFQGTASAAAAPFGDGLRCVQGVTLRLPLKTVSSGTAAYPQSGETGISDFLQSLNAGDTRYYQAWYRDSASYCSASTFNFTNALKVIWSP